MNDGDSGEEDADFCDTWENLNSHWETVAQMEAVVALNAHYNEEFSQENHRKK